MNKTTEFSMESDNGPHYWHFRQLKKVAAKVARYRKYVCYVMKRLYCSGYGPMPSASARSNSSPLNVIT